jgi:succinate dehydrogenase/fumarate reductase cytochrome b subunit
MKTARISGWLLFGLVLLYILTGFSLTGEFGLSRLISLQTALAVHKIFEWPLIAVFVVHSAITIYFAFRRWGWIKTRRKTRRSVKPSTSAPATKETHEPHVAKS